MGTVTPVVVAGEGYVRVEVDWRDFPHTRKCWIYRRVAGVRTTLREGSAVRLSGGVAVAFDHEMPYDVPVEYSSVMALNYNGDFEDGVSEWLDTTNSGTVGTVTQSKSYYVVGEGVASARLVPNGSSAEAQAVSEFIPATVGATYTLTGRIMLSDYWGGGVGVRIHWFNGTSLISTVGAYNDLAPIPGFWGSYGFSAVAPATTTQMKIMFGAQGTPPDTLNIYGDEMYATTSGSTATAAPVIVPSDGVGWWVDPLHPATKTRLIMNLQAIDCVPESAIGLVGLGPESFPGDEEALPINNLALPIGAWQVRKGGQQSIQVATVTLADLAQLKALHATGAPLLLQLPAEYGEAPAYQLHGDLDVARLAPDHRHPWRLARSSFAKVLAPVGPPEGTYGSRYVDFTELTTFASTFSQGGGLYDDMNRTVGAGGWGSPTLGPGTWAVTGTATDYQVNGTTGLMSLGSLAVARRARDLSVSVADFTALVTTTISATLTGGGALGEFGLRLRYVDDNNFVDIRIFRSPTNITGNLRQRVGGVDTATAFPVITGAAGNASISMRFIGVGSVIIGTFWITGAVEPTSPQLNLTGLTHLTAGAIELNASLNASVTNVLPVTAGFDDIQVYNLGVGGSPTWLDGLQGELMA